MKKITRTGYLNLLFHVLLWGALLLLPYIVSTAGNDFRIGVFPGLFFTITVLIHIVILYGNAFFLYPFFFNRRFWRLYTMTAILLTDGSFQMKYYIIATWFPGVPEDMTAYKFVFGPSVAIFIIRIIYRRVVDRIRYEWFPFFVVTRILFIACMVFIIGYVFGGFSRRPALAVISKVAAIVVIVLFIASKAFFMRGGYRHFYERGPYLYR